MRELLLVAAVVLALLGAALFVSGLRGVRRRRLTGGALGATSGLLLVALGALALTLSAATQGYRAFTREETVATVETRPMGPQTFAASFRFPDGREQTFELAGDELYVDAHILKWQPLAAFLGLHTQYELDRVAGRYTVLEDEQRGRRTVFSLAEPKSVDLFALRRRFTWLRPLVDAEYGSATFIAAGERASYTIAVSTTGLLVRRVP
jgi:hypothetical protein